MPFRRTVRGILQGRMEDWRSRGLERKPLSVCNPCHGVWTEKHGRECVSYLSNDYLGLAQNERWQGIVAEAFASARPSSSASRLVSGWDGTAASAERAFAAYFGSADCLFFPSGYQGNLALMTAFVQKGQPVLVDRRIHASTAHALAATRADMRPYAHNDMAHLERRLRALDGEWQPVVVTESLFSMDGSVTDAAAMAELRQRHDFFLIVDEAHAVGCLGEGGRGLFAGNCACDAVLGTLGKGLGFFGAFALLAPGLMHMLENLSSPVMHSTALPPAHALACLGLVGLLPELDAERARLAANAAFFRDELKRLDIPSMGPAHIVSVPAGGEERCTELARGLEERGILVLAARHPTVPLGQALLRFSVSALHERDMLAETARVLKELMD